MDRRTFIAATAAAAVHLSRPSAWPGAVAVELGSIDGSVGGNTFTPVQFLDYLSSIKLTWAMVSLRPEVLSDEAAVRAIRAHADKLGIKLQLAFGSVCPSSRSFNAQLGTLEEQVARGLNYSRENAEDAERAGYFGSTRALRSPRALRAPAHPCVTVAASRLAAGPEGPAYETINAPRARARGGRRDRRADRRRRGRCRAG